MTKNADKIFAKTFVQYKKAKERNFEIKKIQTFFASDWHQWFFAFTSPL